LNPGSIQQKNSYNRYCHINREKNAPAQTERRNSLRSSPHRNIRRKERSYSLHELAESKATGKPVASDDIGKQRIQRSLHQRISDTQQRKRNQHQHITVSENRQQQRSERDKQAQQ